MEDANGSSIKIYLRIKNINNTCCFLNEQHILEECLLANVEKPIEAIHKITAI